MTKLLPAALLLAACASQPDAPVHGAGRCDAAKAQKLIGREASQALGAEALRLSHAGALRWIPEGAMVTTDYREDRLNLELDRNSRVKAVRCG